MSYHNWFHDWFRYKHKNAFNGNADFAYMNSIEDVLDDVFGLMEARAYEYLENNEVYEDLYIDPKCDVLNSKPQVIQQVRDELREFLKILLEHKVKNVLQIGLGHYGSTHFAMSLLFEKVITIDVDIKNIRNYVDREILYNANKEFLHCGDSRDPVFVKMIPDELVDCLFIDGNHTYEYVLSDFQMYYPKVRSGGIVAFHDAKLEAERYGTPRVLREIKDKHDIKLIDHSNEVGIAWFVKE